MFQLPHHFEALRCRVIESLWDGPHGREPMRDLMSDITGYCRSELSLGCPKPKILTHTRPALDSFTFMDCGVIYEVSRDGATITLNRVCTPGGRCIWVSTLCADAITGNVWACFYDGDTRKLYLVYEHGCLLVEYDMASNKTGKPIRVRPRPPPRLNRLFVAVIDDLLFEVSEAAELNRIIGFDVLAVPLSVMKGGVKRVHSVGSDYAEDMSVAGIFAIPGSPRSANVIFKSHSIWHSFRIHNLNFWDGPSGGPKMCRKQEDEDVKSQRISGDLVKYSLGLGLLLLKEGDRFVLRRPSDLGRVATFENRGEPLLSYSPVIFDRFAFCCTRYFSNPDPVTAFLESTLLSATTPIS